MISTTSLSLKPLIIMSLISLHSVILLSFQMHTRYPRSMTSSIFLTISVLRGSLSYTSIALSFISSGIFLKSLPATAILFGRNRLSMESLCHIDCLCSVHFVKIKDEWKVISKSECKISEW